MYVEKNFETYISEKKCSGWSIPKRILAGLDSAHYFQSVLNGNYFISSRSGSGIGLGDWCRVLINGADTIVSSLGRPLNTRGENLDFFVAGDESYMITTSPDGLAVSLKKKDGNWTTPVPLSKRINFGLGMWGPWVTADNRFLFYSTGTKADYSDVAVYWVKINGIIDSIKQTGSN